jgi:hypothetical protein
LPDTGLKQYYQPDKQTVNAIILLNLRNAGSLSSAIPLPSFVCSSIIIIMRLFQIKNHATYRVISLAILLAVVTSGCNMSDESEKLPGGHTYVDEGRCYKFILINIKGVESIESCVGI